MSRYCILLCCCLLAATAIAEDSPRQRVSLNNDWTFAFGAPNDLGYSRYLNKGGQLGIRGVVFKGKPQPVRLPHDWAVDLPPSKDAYDVSAFTPVGPRFPETTIGWYKRKLAIPGSDAGRTMWLELDGIFRNAQIWVNSTFVGRQEGGYQRARFDVTDLVMPGKLNDLWVRVDASQHEGWWYEGAGIYRNAWLVKTAPLAIAPDSVFIHPEFPDNVPGEKARVPVDLALLNRGDADTAAELKCEILDPQGASVAQASMSLAVPARTTAPAKLAMEVKAPALWSPESPVLYSLVTKVLTEGKVIDEMRTPWV